MHSTANNGLFLNDANAEAFREKMTLSMLHFLAFPLSELEMVLKKRHPNDPKYFLGILNERIGFLKTALLDTKDKPNMEWKHRLASHLNGDLNQLTDRIIAEMPESRILREIPLQGLHAAIKANLTVLKKEFTAD